MANDGFLSNPLKRQLRLSGNIFIYSVILGELESFRNYWGILSLSIPKTLGLISFPKILADLFPYPKRHFYQSENTRP